MINISRRHPWALWPESIAPEFVDKPASGILQGNQYWKIEVEFEYTGANMHLQKDIFCIVPKYTGLSIFEKRIFIGVGHDDKDDWHGTDTFIEPGVRERWTFEHKVNDSLHVYRKTETLHNTLVHSYGTKNRPLAVVEDPIVFIGTDKHIVENQPTETDIIMYEFKISDKEGVIAHHDFEELVHDKSIDKTGNCNLLYNLG